LICPITSQVKGYPFEVPLPKGFAVTGVVLVDQVRSLDWRVRKAEFQGRLMAGVVKEVLAKLQLLLQE
jgi:mRNA interferase MazF